MSTFKLEMGGRLRQVREQCGFSREKLAELADINDKFLYEVEVGHKGISAERLRRLTDALAISADYILSGTHAHNDYGLLNAMLSRFSAQDILSVEKILRELLLMTRSREASS